MKDASALFSKPQHFSSTLFLLWVSFVGLNFSRVEAQGEKEKPVPIKPTLDVTRDKLVNVSRLVHDMLPRVSNMVVAFEGGSGVIVTPDGWVLTAAHVSGTPGRNIKVRLANGVQWPAQTAGVNWQSDIGLVRLLGDQDWPHLMPAENKTMKPGQWCVAFGFPWDDKNPDAPAVRVGRVSQVADDRIVTDIPVIGGDSGGPVLNLNGQVVGINSRIQMDVDHNIHVPIQQFAADWRLLVLGLEVQPQGSVQLSNRGNTKAADDFSRNSTQVQAALAPLIDENRSSLVRLSIRPIALEGSQDSLGASSGEFVVGTIVSRSGLIVAKRSELMPRSIGAENTNDDQHFYCEVNGIDCQARLITVQDRIDLALLQLDAKPNLEFKPINISDANGGAKKRVGTILISLVAKNTKPGTDIDDPSSDMSVDKLAGSLGLVMVPPQNFQMISDRQDIDFGVLFGPDPELFVKGVFPSSMADNAGVKVGDRIARIDGISVKTSSDFQIALSKLVAGQHTQLSVVRAGRDVSLGVELPDKLPLIWDRWGGGPFSNKRFDFGVVIAHDGVITPADCGTPLLDLEGNAVGINISRAMRNTTFAIPIETVAKFIREHRPNAKIGRQ